MICPYWATKLKVSIRRISNQYMWGDSELIRCLFRRTGRAESQNKRNQDVCALSSGFTLSNRFDLERLRIAVSSNSVLVLKRIRTRRRNQENLQGYQWLVKSPIWVMVHYSGTKAENLNQFPLEYDYLIPEDAASPENFDMKSVSLL